MFTCLEVEYALNADKAVIPIRIHRSYVLDGWLSGALASHSLLNFADTEDFDAGMMQLLQRVSAITGPVATSDAGNSFTMHCTFQLIITLVVLLLAHLLTRRPRYCQQV